ncbi:MAG: hypothetical protein IKV54_03875 [Clostridia bacterium]|nr:hypothetical protein [Clostridia bacterium]
MNKNEELKKILLVNQEKYPFWEICDAVKLIYQNEFGGRHLIRDREKCVTYIRNEIESADCLPDCPDTEDIGGGTVRANLIPLAKRGISAEDIADAFIKSTLDEKGSVDSLREKLLLLTDMTNDGQLSFSRDRLWEFLSEYSRSGYPAISHSERYKKEYFPAYRLISKKYLPF